MSKEEVKIRRAWLESLVACVEKVEKSQDDGRDFAIACLIGYASSAKYILERASRVVED